VPDNLGPTTFFGKIRYEDGLLGLPDQSGRAFFNWALMAAYEVGGHVRLNGVQSHRVSDRIVQRQGDKIHMDNPRQALGEISKEFVEIAVYGNRLRNLQQSLVSLRESLTGRCGMLIHRWAVWRIGR
jgi:hypothetical protein